MWFGLISLVSAVLVVNCDPAATSFYPNNPDIVELTNANFVSTLQDANKAYLVEFYMSWCGHCRAFAPKFKAFAKRVSGWKNLVKVAAINCASDDGKLTCQNQGITGVPTLKYFSPGSAGKTGVVVPTFRTTSKLKSALLDSVISDDKLSHVIDFRPLKGNDARLSAVRTPLAAIVVEDTLNSTIAHEIMVELHNHPRLTVFRAQSDHPLVASLDLDGTPAIVFFKDGQAVSQAGLRDILRTSILEYVDGVVSTHAPTDATTSSSATAIPPNINDKSKFFVSEADMLLAAKETLNDEVPFKAGIMNSDDVLALENYLEILSNYFPTRGIVTTPDGRAVIQELASSKKAVLLFGYMLRWLKMQRSLGATVTSRAWSARLAASEKAYGSPFPTGDWQHCKGSSPNFRGYTCGLWSMFHSMTVQAYMKHKRDDTWDPKSVVQGIRGYVKTFFGCTNCKEHFLAMSANITEELVSKEDSFMWLWQAHNQVNRRLAGRPETEDPSFPKRQFPAAFLCPTCKTVSGHWQYEDVVRFLLQYYTNIRPVKRA